MVYLPRRVDDSHIMDGFSLSDTFSDNIMNQINLCRLYLQVILMSDITMPCGNIINPLYYKEDLTHHCNWPTVMYLQYTGNYISSF
jgi:hypothetical protein